MLDEYTRNLVMYMHSASGARVEVVALALGGGLVDDADRALQRRPRQLARQRRRAAAKVQAERAAPLLARRVQQALVRACTRPMPLIFFNYISYPVQTRSFPLHMHCTPGYQ